MSNSVWSISYFFISDSWGWDEDLSSVPDHTHSRSKDLEQSSCWHLSNVIKFRFHTWIQEVRIVCPLLLCQRCMIQLPGSGSWVQQDVYLTWQEWCCLAFPHCLLKERHRVRWKARPRPPLVHMDALIHISGNWGLSLSEAQSNNGTVTSLVDINRTGPSLYTSGAWSKGGNRDTETERDYKR